MDKAKRVTRKVGVHVTHKTAKQLDGFVEFIKSQGVVGLAVGLVIGTQVKGLVDSLIHNFIDPLIGIVLPGQGDLSSRFFTVTIDKKTAVFGWGGFLYTLIDFVIVLAVIYLIFKALKLDKLQEKDTKKLEKIKKENAKVKKLLKQK